MSRRNKLLKFAELAAMPNTYENFSVSEPQLLSAPDTPVDLCDKWQSHHFKNSNPLTLELACGRGEYTVALAQRFPDRNFIGVDIKGARIWKGAKQALEKSLDNSAFLRTRIECIDAFFAPEEVDEIWITFPDPFPRDGQKNRRLTSSIFFDVYRRVLKPGGTIHLKTDDTNLFLFTMEQIITHNAHLIQHTDDIDAYPLDIPELKIPTFYENLNRGKNKRIKYLSFRIGRSEG